MYTFFEPIYDGLKPFIDIEEFQVQYTICFCILNSFLLAKPDYMLQVFSAQFYICI